MKEICSLCKDTSRKEKQIYMYNIYCSRLYIMYIYVVHDVKMKKKKKTMMPETLNASNISDDTCKEFLRSLFMASLLVIC